MLTRPSILVPVLSGLLLVLGTQRAAEAGFIAPDQQHGSNLLPAMGAAETESVPRHDAIDRLLNSGFRDLAFAETGSSMGSRSVQDSPGGAPAGLSAAGAAGVAASPSFGSLVPLHVSLPPPFASRWFRPPRI